jgi:hypothetical protein
MAPGYCRDCGKACLDDTRRDRNCTILTPRHSRCVHRINRARSTQKNCGVIWRCWHANPCWMKPSRALLRRFQKLVATGHNLVRTKHNLVAPIYNLIASAKNLVCTRLNLVAMRSNLLATQQNHVATGPGSVRANRTSFAQKHVLSRRNEVLSRRNEVLLRRDGVVFATNQVLCARNEVWSGATHVQDCRPRNMGGADSSVRHAQDRQFRVRHARLRASHTAPAPRRSRQLREICDAAKRDFAAQRQCDVSRASAR